MTTLQKTIKFMDPHDLTVIGLDTQGDESHPLYDPRVHNTLEGEAIDHADEYGITEPVLATRYKGMTIVVAGRHRTRICREVNALREGRGDEAMTVPVVITPYSNGTDLMTLMVRENMLRRDLTPLDKGRMAMRLLDLDLDLDDVAQRMGVTTQSIKDWTKVLEMDPQIVAAVEKGQISANKALTTFRKTPISKQAAKFEALKEGLKKIETAQGGPKKKKVRVRNMNKQYANKIARMSDEDAAALGIDPLFLLALRWAHGKATDTDCRRDVASFQKALNWAKKALGED